MHPLQQQIRHVSGSAKRLLWRHAIANVIAFALLVAMVVGVIDYVFRFHDFGLRVICSLCVLAAFAACAWRFLRPAFRWGPSDVVIAKKIEQSHPELAGELSSAVAFLEQDASDPTAGSLSLRQSVVASVQSSVESIDLKACLEKKGTRRATWFATAIVVALVAAIFIQPQNVLLSMRRLAFPWADNPWPRDHRLMVIEAPSKIVAGDDLEIVVRDANGTLPDRVTIHYWYDGEPPSRVRTEAMDVLNNRAVHRLVNVSKSFQFRVSGGDDDTMEWSAVGVVLRPQVSEIQVKIIPPAYSGLPESTAQHELRLLEGSSAVVSGVAAEGTLFVRMVYLTEKHKLMIPAELEGLKFTINRPKDLVLDASGKYWFEVFDSRALLGGDERKWDVRAIPDLPPTVSLQSIVRDGFTTPRAQVSLKALVKDDLAVLSIGAQYKVTRAGDNGETTTKQTGTIPLFTAKTRPGGVAPAQTTSLTDGDKQQLDYNWDLSQLGNLEPGDTLELHLVASDFKRQIGKSAARRWSVISTQEFENRVVQRQSRIISRLAEILQLQRDAREQVANARIEIEEAQSLNRRHVQRMQSGELTQRGVVDKLADRSGSVQQSIRELLRELKDNRVDNPDSFRRLQRVLTSLNALNASELPTIQTLLTGILKTAREAVAGKANGAQSVPDQLGKTIAQQDAVITVLDKLVGDLSQWDSYRRFAREISQVAKLQVDIHKRTRQLMLDTLSKGAQELTTKQRTEMRQLAQSQSELARRFERIQGRMEATSNRLQDTDPLAAATIMDAIEAARRAAISGQMRDSSRRVGNQQFGQAADQQAEVAQGLKDILEILSNRREMELDRIARQLNSAAGQARRLQGQQRQLQEKIRAANNQSGAAKKAALGKLAPQAKKLADEIQKLSRRLQRLEARKAADTSNAAASDARGAGKAAEQGNGGEAEKKNDQTGKKLKQVEQQIKDRKREIEQDLFQERFAQMEQAIKGIRQRQANLHGTIGELDKKRQVQGRLKRSQLLTIQNAAQQQSDLATETGELSQQLSHAAAFQLSLQGISKEMFRAAAGLERAETGPNVQTPQQHALERLDQLLLAMKEQGTPPPKDDNQGPPKNGGAQQGGNQAQLMQLLAELRLARMMQVRLAERTESLEKIKLDKGLTERQDKEYQQLAEEQGKLADIFYNLIQAQQNPELSPQLPPDPNKPPDGQRK